MQPNLGEILLKAGLITRDDLERALLVQARRGGRLGELLARMGVTTQRQIDEAWARAVVTPRLEEAIDRACQNRFSICGDRGIEYTSLKRRDLLVEDMLSGSTLIETDVSLLGEAVLRMGEHRSLPIEFTVACDSWFAMLSDTSEAIVRRWVPMVERRSTEDKAAKPAA